MDNSLQVFNYNGNSVRTVEIDGEAWFVGKDVADILGYVNHRDAIAKHIDDEDKRMSQIATPSNGGYSDMIVINESGVYSLIFSSKLPTAKEFKHWVTSEVLPAIRKSGSYSMRKNQSQRKSIPADVLRAAEKVLTRAFKCKSSEDFQTVLALDEIFRHYTGESALEIAGLKLVKKSGTKYYPIRLTDGSRSSYDWDYEFYAWEHNYPPILDEDANMPDFLRRDKYHEQF